MMRSAGVILPIFSLPSPYGIGTLGKAAYRFADFLHAAGQHYWQILPIGPTSYGDSPYQSFSTHAGNPYFIDLDLLAEEGLIDEALLQEVDWSCSEKRVDYGFQFWKRYDILAEAFHNGEAKYEAQLAAFRTENPWLEDYALFMAIKRANGMQSWDKWPDALRFREPAALAQARTEYDEDIRFFVFLQFLFYRQWKQLREYIRSLGMELIGDIPIYVPFDSCETWKDPDLFQLDAERIPTAVAGCPPDYFQEDGQLWGNPLYRWEKMEEDDFAWWRDRIAAAGALFDVIRLDHFRGLESYWSVPFGDPTARGGKWVKGPGKRFVDCLKRHFPELKLIAEDLGFLTEEVADLLAYSGFPGMRVLEFAFDAAEPSNYLPHRLERNAICYTDTHDNEPIVQWLNHADDAALDYIREYFGVGKDADLAETIVRAGNASVCDTFIAQLQDYLELGEGSRINFPGVLSMDNWTWRLDGSLLTEALAEKMKKMADLYERRA